MKIALTELQSYIDAPLPDVAHVVDAFTFHAFEIDGIERDVLDVKVLPNRAADCGTAEGVAQELAAILDLPLKDTSAPAYPKDAAVAVTVAGIQNILGIEVSREEMLDVCRRLRFKVEEEGETLQVTAPAPRTDITIQEDVAEEIGQILGYERVPATALPATTLPVDDARFRGQERMKDQLVAEGFIELSTQSFTKKGDVYLANPMDKTKPALRTSLEANLKDALDRVKLVAPLILPPNENPKLFEAGAVFPKDDEHIELRMTEAAWDGVPTVDNLSVAKLEEYGKDYEPERPTLGAYVPFSVYPFITRDVAAWIPKASDRTQTESLLREHAGELLVRLDHSDTYEKERRTSLAFRLVFQAMDRTLTDEEVNGVMGKVYAALTEKGYEIR